MNLNKIITEEINNVILENTQFQFQQLEQCYYDLRACRDGIRQTDLKSTGNKQLINFVGHEFYNFIVAVEAALLRCIQSNSINESLADYGINLPPELSNIGRTASEYYYWMNNMLGRNGYVGKGGNQMPKNEYTDSQPIQTNTNQKLLDLLYNVWPQMQQKFLTLDSYFKIGNVCQPALNAKQTIEDIISIVKTINNAQGQNP
jgi:hypothetical protein